MKKIFTSLSMLIAAFSAVAQTQFIEPTSYRGAFAPSPTPMWTDTWTNWDPDNNTSYGTPDVTVTANITNNTTWTANHVYLLSGQIYVKNGATLTIDPGTVIMGDYNVLGSGLFITQGSKINAIGTASSPIVFTSNQPAGSRIKGDWGGIILMGRAAINIQGATPGIANIEGIAPSSDTQYGGGTSPDNNDNSGTLKYVRIEFAGYAYQQDKEINGLTFGGVGKGTTIDYVQVSFSNDDAFEWFGGNVNCKHLVSYRNLDDDFDTDFGYSGLVQFGLSVRDPQVSDNPTISTSEGFESDNDPSGTNNSLTPYTSALFSNMTLIGPLRGNVGATVDAGYRRGARLRRNTHLKIFNSIFMDHLRGIHIDGSATIQTETNAANGDLKFRNNLVAGTLAGKICERNAGRTFDIWNWFATSNNDSLVSSAGILTTPYSFTAPDYRPASGSPALANMSYTDAAFAGNILCTLSAPTITGDLSVCAGSTTTLTAPSGLSYNWGANGSTQSISVSAAGTYSVTVTDVYGCTASNSVTVVVNSLPTATITGNDSICIGQSTTLTGNSGFYTYNWTGGAISQSINANASGTYTLTLTDVNGCTDTETFDVVVSSLPSATISGDLSICAGDNNTLSVPVGNSYLWNNNTTSNTINASAAGTYSVTVTSPENCTATASATVVVNALPTATIAGNDSICIGQSTTLTGNSGFFTYSWTGGANSQSINANASGTYTLTLTDVNGCTDTETFDVVVSSLPSATISGDLSICAGDNNTLSVPAGNSYLWNNNTTSNTINASAAGTYSVTVTSPENCTATASATVVVNALPTVAINGATEICNGSSTVIVASGASNMTWTNNGFTTASLNVSPTVDSTFTVVGTDANGCSNAASISITVNSVPVMSTQPTIAAASCGQADGSLTGADVNGNGTLTFSWTNASNQSVGSAIDASNLTAGVYNLTVVDANSCTASFGPYSISNPGAPTAPVITVDDSTVCAGTAITFSAQSAGTSVTYSWTGPAFNSTSQSNTLSTTTTANSGVYAVTATENNCVSQASLLNISVAAIPSVNLAATTNSVCINGANVTLIGLPAGGAYSGTNVSANQFTPATAGANVATYSFTDANGCANTATTSIMVNDLPTVSVSGSVNAVCINSTTVVTLNGLPAGGAYSGAGVSGNNFYQTIAGTGTHTVTYAYTDANGCANTATSTIDVNAAPTVTLAAASSQACANNTTLALTPSPSGGVYSGTSAVTGNNYNPSIAGVGSETVTYTFTNANSCSNAASVVITVNALPTVTLGSSVSAICINSANTVNLTGAPAGGTYSGAGVSGNTFYESIAGAGTHTATYTFTSANGCSNSATTSITVNTAPTVTLTAAATQACLNHTALALTGLPAGGTYSGSTAITGSNYNPSVAGIGNDTIKYVFTNTNGCSNSAQVVINVSPCTGIIETTVNTNNVSLYPNPTSDLATLEIFLAENENVTAFVFDMTGKLVIELANNKFMDAGSNKINFEATSLDNGIYCVMIKAGAYSKTMKMVVNK